MAAPRYRSWPCSSPPSCRTAWRTSKQTLPASPHNIVGSLHTLRFVAKQAARAYIRLLFANSQGLQPGSARQPGKREARLGVFRRLLRLSEPTSKRSIWKEVVWSLSYFARTVTVPHQHIEGVHRAAETPS